MALNFPSSPSDGQLHIENSITYRYSSSVGAWLIVPAEIPNAFQGLFDKQIIFNNQGSSNGSNGLTFSTTANTLYTHNVAVTANVAATYFLGNGALLTGVVSDFSPAFNKANDSYSLAQTAFDRANTSNDVLFIVGAYDTANAAFDKANAANLLAYETGIGANAYSVSVGTAGNNFAGVMANAANSYAASLTPDLSSVYIYANNVGSAGNANLSVATVAANSFASSVGSSGNTYAEEIGTAGNTYASAVGTAANANLSVATIAANSYSDSVGLSANNNAGALANAANAYSSAYSRVFANSVGTAANANLSVGTIAANSYADAVGTAANANLSVGTISANNWANTKLANTDGVVFNGTLNIKTDLDIGNNITSVNSVIFNTSAGITTAAEGQMTWNADESTFDFGMANGSILQVGQEIFYRVKNQTGSTIPEGTVVMSAGTLGASGRILVAPAVSDGTYPSKYLMGIATGNIANGGDGYVTAFGKVRGIDTSMWSEGDILYANVSVAGGLQNTMPTAPNTKTTVAIVVSKHATTGTLFVRPTYGSKLNEDELVELSSLTNGDVLVYNSTPGRFENKVQLALNAGSVNGYSANDIIDAANTYTRVFANSVGAAANNFAGSMANAANVIAIAAFDAANAAASSSNTAGYFSSTIFSFPTGNYGNGESYISSSIDAFGVSLIPTFNLMDPSGRLETVDLGTL